MPKLVIELEKSLCAKKSLVIELENRCVAAPPPSAHHGDEPERDDWARPSCLQP